MLSKKLSGSEKKKVHKDINTLNKLVYNITQTFNDAFDYENDVEDVVTVEVNAIINNNIVCSFKYVFFNFCIY